MDAFAHVNNNTLFSLFDNAKYRYFTDLFGNDFFKGRGIVVANVTANFFSPVFFPGKVCVKTAITRIGTKSFTFHQEMSDPDTGDQRCECTTIMVAYDVAARRSLELSPEEKARIREFEGLVQKK